MVNLWENQSTIIGRLSNIEHTLDITLDEVNMPIKIEVFLEIDDLKNAIFFFKEEQKKIIMEPKERLNKRRTK